MQHSGQHPCTEQTNGCMLKRAEPDIGPVIRYAPSIDGGTANELLMCSMRRIVCIAAIIEIMCLGPAPPHPQLTQHILAADSCLKCRKSVSLAEPHMQRINVHLRTAAKRVL